MPAMSDDHGRELLYPSVYYCAKRIVYRGRGGGNKPLDMTNAASHMLNLGRPLGLVVRPALTILIEEDSPTNQLQIPIIYSAVIMTFIL